MVKLEVVAIVDELIWMTRLDEDAIEMDIAAVGTLHNGVFDAIRDILVIYKEMMGE